MLNEKKRRVKKFDIKCLMRALGVNGMDRIGNRDIREKCGYRRNMLEGVD